MAEHRPLSHGRPTPPCGRIPASALPAWLEAFANRVWDEVMAHPGSDGDEVDREQWRRAMRLLQPLARASRLDLGTIHPDATSTWSAGVWSVFIGIRRAPHRPRWDEVAALLARHLGAEMPRTLEAGVAQTYRVVTAPREERFQLPGQVERFQLPGQVDDAPSWLADFPSMDHGGTYDRALMVCLTHMGEECARKTIRKIHSQRRQAAADRANRAQDQRERRQAQAARASGTDRVGELLDAIHRRSMGETQRSMDETQRSMDETQRSMEETQRVEGSQP